MLKKALKYDQPEVLASLADHLTDLGFSDLSKKVYQQLIDQFPKEDLFKVYLAEILINDGNEDQGLDLLYSIDPQSTAYVSSLLVQSDYYQTSGLIETARAKLEEAEKLAPNEDAIKFGLAELDFWSGHYQTALPRYEDLLKRQDQFEEVSLKQRLLITLAKLGQYESAAEILKKEPALGLDLDTQYEAGLIMLGVKNLKAAIRYLNEVLKTAPDYVNAYDLLAQAYLKTDQFDAALKTAHLGLSYNEFDESLYELGTQSALKLKEWSTAESLLKKGLKIAPDNSDLRLQLSNLYLYEHHDQENLELWQTQSDEVDLEPQAHWNLAVSYQRLEKIDQAKGEFLLAYPEFKENSEFLRQMILFFKEIGTKPVLNELLKKYLALVPDDLEMHELQDQLDNDNQK